MLRIFNICKLTQTLTLRTAITASNTRTDQVPPVTPAVTPIQKYTPIDKQARNALCIVKKYISLQGIPKKNVTSLIRDLITILTSSF